MRRLARQWQARPCLVPGTLDEPGRKGFLIYVTSDKSPRRWTNTKRDMAFAQLVNDGDDEGMFFLGRLPTAAEAEVIPERVGIRRAPVYDDATLARLRAQSFVAQIAKKNPLRPSSTCGPRFRRGGKSKAIATLAVSSITATICRLASAASVSCSQRTPNRRRSFSGTYSEFSKACLRWRN